MAAPPPPPAAAGTGADPTVVRDRVEGGAGVGAVRGRQMTLAALPAAALLDVLAFATPGDLGRAACVCERWNRLAGRSLLWEPLAERRARGPAEEVDAGGDGDAAERRRGWRRHVASYPRHRHLTAKQYYCMREEAAELWRRNGDGDGDSAIVLAAERRTHNGMQLPAGGISSLFVPTEATSFDWRTGTHTSSNKDVVVACSGPPESVMRVWSLPPAADAAAAGRCVRTQSTPAQTCIDVSDRFIALGTNEPGAAVEVLVYSVQAGVLLHRLTGHDSTVTCVRILASTALGAPLLVSSGYDRVVCIWNLDNGSLVRRLEGHTGTVWCVDAFDSIAQAAAHRVELERMGRLPDDPTDVEVGITSGPGAGAAAAAAGGASDAGSAGGSVAAALWAAGDALPPRAGDDATADGAGVSVRDRQERAARIQLRRVLVCSGGNDNNAIVWDAADSGAPRRTLAGHTNTVMAIKADAVSRRVLTTGYDSSVREWDLDSGEELHCMLGHEGVVLSLDVDWRRGLAASGGRDCTVRLWDIVAGSCLCVLRGHTSDIKALWLDGPRLISGSYDGTLRVHDVRPRGAVRGGAGADDAPADDGCTIS